MEKLSSLAILAGGIAHDFNNILTGVLGNISLAIMSVEALNLTRPLDIDRRIHAVEQFRSDSAAEALAAANKRVGNILAKEAGIPTGVTESALVDDAEMALFRALLKASASAEKAVALNDYRAALAALATLRPDVDRFFDNVMVMVDDVTLRQNRLALLNMLRNSFLSIADISVLNP